MVSVQAYSGCSLSLSDGLGRSFLDQRTGHGNAVKLVRLRATARFYAVLRRHTHIHTYTFTTIHTHTTTLLWVPSSLHACNYLSFLFSGPGRGGGRRLFVLALLLDSSGIIKISACHAFIQVCLGDFRSHAFRLTHLVFASPYSSRWDGGRWTTVCGIGPHARARRCTYLRARA